MEAFTNSRKPLQVLGSSLAWCLGQMRPSPMYRHQWNSLEPWRVPYNSSIFQNVLHHSRYKDIQETSGILQKALDSSHAFSHSVELCGFLQASLEPSTLFPLQESPKASWLYISLRGGSFESVCDTKPTQTHLAHQALPQAHLGTWPIRHRLRPTQAPQAHLDTLGPLGTTLRPLRHPRPSQAHLAHQAPFQAYLGTLGPFRSFFAWLAWQHDSYGLHVLDFAFYIFFFSIYQFYSFIYLFLGNCMSLIIIFTLFLFIFLLIYFDRKLLELIIHFSFACDLYF